MGALNIYFILLCTVWFTTVCNGKRGFILTSPKVLDTGSTEYFPLTLFDVSKEGTVRLRLLKADSDDIISESQVYSAKSNMWMQMSIPQIPDERAKLNIIGEFNSDYEFNEVKEVRLRHKSIITFIQTDKPVYKPGQTVRFRVLPMNVKLQPIAGKTVGEVWIEDPAGVRVAQWKNVKFEVGIVQLELPLSNEPVLGDWKIKVSIKNTTHSQTFLIKEYVLPKFEVVITPPSYIMVDAQDIVIKICAQYTYGKQVDGMITAKITYQKYLWNAGVGKVLPLVIHEEKISGCYNFEVKSSDLLLDHPEFRRRKFEIFAEVTENGTEVTRNSTYILDISRSPLKIKFLGADKGPQYYKAGLPFYGELKVSKPDWTPAPSEKIEVCANVRTLLAIKKYCKTFTSDKHGHISFSVPPQDLSSRSIMLQATGSRFPQQKYHSWLTKIEMPSAMITLKPWYSQSGSYLQIEPITREVQCEKPEKVKIRYTGEKGFAATFYHQVISRGLIVQQGFHHRSYHDVEDGNKGDVLSLEKTKERDREPYAEEIDDSLQTLNITLPPHIGEFTLSFDARATMSPIARLLVFYVRSDGEVVADSLEFRISPCLLNKAILNFRHEQQYPNTETAILLSASPSSMCGIGLVDKSVHLLHPERQLSKEKVFKFLESYDVNRESLPKQVSHSRCERDNSFGSEWHWRSLNYESGFSGFFSSPFVDTMTAFEEAGMVVISDYRLESRPCQIRRPVGMPDVIRPRMVFNLHADFTSEAEGSLSQFTARSSNAVRTHPIGNANSEAHEDSPAKSTVEVRNYFPETWLWELINVGETGEVTFKRELPHTITKWIGSAICVHPQTGLGFSDASSITAFQPFFISYTLPYSVIRDEVVPVIVSVFNYLTECLPIKLSLEPSESFKIVGANRNHKLCVCGGKSASHKFLIRPVMLGEVNVTAYGYSMEEDTICENEITARMTARDAVTKSLLVEAEGFPKEEVFNIYFCPSQNNGSYTTEVDLLLPENVIEGSSRAFASVTGDLMGPALNGLDQLVKLPVGCGEQNMILFTPNIFVMDYLISTARITPEIKSKAISHMKTGYQRELRYRHKDGSYSAFGESDDQGSIWLTSFVVRSFAQARRFISLDESDLALSTSWIVMKQFENGCFENVGKVLHKAMKGGLDDDDQSLSPLTAYVLISLLEAGFVNSKVIDSALRCIQNDQNPSSYSLALFAYATALAKHEAEAEEYIRKLESRGTIEDGILHWDYQQEKYRSVSVEIAGYAILALLENGGLENVPRALPIVRWITKQRNSNGGFVSTQDTVVALQALAKYASYNKENDRSSLSVDVESDDLIHNFKLNEYNKLLTMSVKIPTLPTVIDFQATGSGCALAQFTLKYNVESIPGSDAFDLEIVSSRKFRNSICSLPTIGICMRYKIPRLKSNMVVVAVKMVSGYVPDELSLHQLQKDKNLQLKRHDVSGNEINFYFYELTNEQKCFQFNVQNELAVENSKPASVKLYDYYQPELEVMKDYDISPTCTLHEISDLPELPPFKIDSDDEDIFLPPFEVIPLPTGNLSSVGNPSTTLSTEDSIFENITENTSSTFQEENLKPLLESNKTLTQNLDDETRTEIFSSTEPDTSELLELTSSNPDSNSVTSVININEDVALADIDPIPPTANPGSQDHFVNVDHDLDTPDGQEGNMAVTVLPPENFPIATNEEEMNVLDCPVCFQNFPANFSDIYCSSAFALRVNLRDRGIGGVKLIHDISSFYDLPQRIKEFGILLYDKRCICSPLEHRRMVLLIGLDADSWIIQDKKHRFIVTSRTYIISVPAKLIQPTEVRNARKECKEDP